MGTLSGEEGRAPRRKDSKKKGKSSAKPRRYRTDQERVEKERERRNANNQRERWAGPSYDGCMIMTSYYGN